MTEDIKFVLILDFYDGTLEEILPFYTLKEALDYFQKHWHVNYFVYRRWLRCCRGWSKDTPGPCLESHDFDEYDDNELIGLHLALREISSDKSDVQIHDGLWLEAT